MKITPFKTGDDEAVDLVLSCLRWAHDVLARRGARKAAAKVRRALASAEGAVRQIVHRRRRAERAA
jgi:hypothetical protein